MSVLIRGMRPTHSCEACPCYKPYDFGTRTGDSCNVTGTSTDLVEVGEKPDWCPLTEMPPHGRLIDADALVSELAKAIPYIIGTEIDSAYVEGLGRAKIEVDDAPTIIEAEE